MKKLAVFVVLFLMIVLFSTCKNKNTFTWGNKEFNNAIDYYCAYADSAGYKQNYDYITVEAITKSDCTVFLISTYGGAYDFLKQTSKIVDFIIYDKFDVLLTGDFPNRVVNKKKNIRLNIIDDILKVRYPTEYKKYLHDKSIVGPLLYHYMNMTLIFEENRLLSSERLYY